MNDEPTPRELLNAITTVNRKIDDLSDALLDLNRAVAAGFERVEGVSSLSIGVSTIWNIA